MQLILGDCIEELRKIKTASVDAIITDPPAGISFMGKEWDRHKGGRDPWIAWLSEVMREAWRVMKPGAHGLVWALPRTSHWTATALEDSGFEIRDCVYHLFGTGFPKSLDVSKAIDKAAGAEREAVGKAWVGSGNRASKSVYGDYDSPHTAGVDVTVPATATAKQWSGWGTALKPAVECWWLVRKPLSEKTVAANVLKWGTGGISVDGCRVAAADAPEGRERHGGGSPSVYGKYDQSVKTTQPAGRFPANLILDETAAEMLDAQSGTLTSGKLSNRDSRKRQSGFALAGGEWSGDSGGASRFFYVAKASTRERNAGLDRIEIIHVSIGEWESADLRATLQVDTAQFPPRVIDASGTLRKDVSEWNTFLFGNSTSGPQNLECKSTTKTAISSTIESKTLSWLLRWNTSASILAASSSTVSGGSPAEPAPNSNPSPNTTSDVTVTVTSASDALSPVPLQIKSAGALKSTHPTVKPITLMRYLCRLITPPNGVILDPFMGSGTTGIAATHEGFSFIGIEREAEYFEIAKRRNGQT